jgi:ribonuclease III
LPPSFFHRVNKLFAKKNGFYSFICRLTGFRSVDIELYELAFTHRSASIYHGKGFSVNNERLEFLGDSILDAIIADYLFEKFPNENEGFLTSLRSRVVNRQSLNELALTIGLDKFIKAHVDKSGLAPSVMGNALEAFIGAVFIDKEYKLTKKFVIHKLIEPYIDLKVLCSTDTNFKGGIIDWAQKHRREIEFDSREEQSNSKSGHLFSVRLLLDKTEIGFGQAESKKEAEQKAAEEALQKLKNP